jgi:uncharacterized damage-inducible protein DinB
MSNKLLVSEYIRELDAEAASTRKCLERFPETLFGWKPHEKSMTMGYLALLVAEIPQWIAHVIQKGEIDLATFPHYQGKTGADLAKHFEENLKAAKDALHGISDDALSGMFSLKNQAQVLFSSPKGETVSQSINHMVHHRGQLTLYLRLNDIPVPSIYGPSADDKTF